MTTEQRPAQKPAKKTENTPPAILQRAAALFGGPDRPPRGTHPPRVRYRTIWEWLQAKRWMLVRLAVAALVLLLAVGWARPLAEGYIEEQYSAGAVRKGRVLLRGAQIVATQQLVDFATPEDTEQYLLAPENLPAVVDASRFAVKPLEITDVTLNDRGLIDSFGCTLIYENRRYSIQIDATAGTVTPTLLAKLEPPEDDSPADE